MQVELPFPGKPEVTVTISAPNTVSGAGYILALAQRVNDLLNLCRDGVPAGITAESYPRPEDLATSTVDELTVPGSIKAVDLDSSVIAAFSWNPIPEAELGRQGYGNLVIGFKSGRVYVYKDVERHRAEAFEQAESKGEFFNKWIRGRYESGQVSDHGAEEVGSRATPGSA